MKTNADMTIYNRCVTSGVETYQRTQIKGVFWENRKAANVLRAGSLAADSASIYISLTKGGDYLPPKAWQKLANKAGKWTLQIGDYIVRGLVTDEIHEARIGPIPPAESAFQITDLKAAHDDVLEIKSVDLVDYGSPNMHHWQIGAA